MKKTSISFLAEAGLGILKGNPSVFVKGCKIDSRQIEAGDLFIAIKGPTFDGHNYVEAAYQKGCRAFLLSEEKAANELLQNHSDVAAILVENVQDAFEKMAESYLNQFSLIKVGVTGSTGKTSTKAFAASVLASKYKTVCSQKNYNTHLGISLTAFLADESTEAIVFEMGMDTPNELHDYCKWVKPETALITNVGIVHMENIGSPEGIADEKMKITDFFAKENCLIYNCDSPFLNKEEIKKRTHTEFSLYPVGEGAEAVLKLYNAKNKEAEGISFDLSFKEETQHFELPFLGLHNAHNAALAVALGLNYGISMQDAAKAFPNAKFEGKRLEVCKLKKGTLLDDSYNANPDSMASALKTLANFPAKRRIAVISAMRELGSLEEESHIAIGKLCSELNLDILIAIGQNKDYYAKGAYLAGKNDNIYLFDDLKLAEDFIKKLLQEEDVLLIKGSLTTNVHNLASNLRGI